MNSSITVELIAKADQKTFKSLFITKPSIHAVAMLFDWAIILSSIYIYQKLSMWILYPFLVVLIGARMHALTVLMHDATHYRFLKNRKWNDIISNIFIMYPIFTSIEKYRINHLKHHQHLNTENDPDWVAKLTKRAFEFPKTKREFLLNILSYLFLYQGILDAIWFFNRYKDVKEKSHSTTDNKTLKIGFYLTLILVLTVSGLWKSYLIFWIIPYFTSFFMFQYIRSVAEHFGELAYEDELSSSRTVKPTTLELFFIAPHSVGYHLEHHLFPGVPFYHLPQLHQLLMNQKEYQTKAHITQGYLTGLLEELGKSE